MAVGAVYIVVNLCRWIISQYREQSGYKGVLSNINVVAPKDNGPYTISTQSNTLHTLHQTNEVLEVTS